MVQHCIRIAEVRVRFPVGPHSAKQNTENKKTKNITKNAIISFTFEVFCYLGPWYTGNMLPWHGRVRGSIPLGSTSLTVFLPVIYSYGKE